MGYFTPQQNRAVKNVLKTIVETGKEKELIKIIQDEKLIEATEQDAFMEILREDIKVHLENNDESLTENEFEKALYYVIDNADYSSLDDVIETAVQKAKKKQIP